jgi:hypothetical protein
MKNKIIDSLFRSKGIYTIIENPSSLVHSLLNGISIYPPENLIGSIAYYHKDIGTIEEMNQLFKDLESENELNEKEKDAISKVLIDNLSNKKYMDIFSFLSSAMKKLDSFARKL